MFQNIFDILPISLISDRLSRSIPAEKDKWLAVVDALQVAIDSAIVNASRAGIQQPELSEHIEALRKTALEMEIHQALGEYSKHISDATVKHKIWLPVIGNTKSPITKSPIVSKP